MELTEKRKEPRFPFDLPVQLQRGEKAARQQVIGTIKNVSLTGFRALSEVWLAQGERIVCTFDIPETRETSRYEGVIKWCYSRKEHHIGVELLEKHSLALPLKRLSESFSRLKPGLPTWDEEKPADLSDLQQGLYLEIYLGMLLTILHSPLQSHLIRLSAEIGLKHSQLHRLRPLIPAFPLDEPGREHLLGLDKALEEAGRTINRLTRLLQLLLQGQMNTLYHELPEVIRLNDLLAERIAHFEQLLDFFMLGSAGEIVFESHEVPVLFGHRWSIALSLDFLLLYAYQSVVFFGARTIRIETDKNSKNIFIGFSNDGSKIFHPDRILLEGDQPQGLDQLKPGDQKRLAILRRVLELYKPIKTGIVLFNQSGNNLLLVQITPDAG